MTTVPALDRSHAIGIDLHINGQTFHIDVEPWTSLLDALREQFQLTGSKKGCDHGQATCAAAAPIPTSSPPSSR